MFWKTFCDLECRGIYLEYHQDIMKTNTWEVETKKNPLNKHNAYRN